MLQSTPPNAKKNQKTSKGHKPNSQRPVPLIGIGKRTNTKVKNRVKPPVPGARLLIERKGRYANKKKIPGELPTPCVRILIIRS